MIKLMIFNQKGGVGKSTTVVNIAGCLSYNLKKRVLVIDIDGQATASSYLTTIAGPPAYSLYDYIYEDMPIQDIITPIQFEKYDFKKKCQMPQETLIDLLPSSRYFGKPGFFDEFQETDLFNKIFSEIVALKDSRYQYDYVIFDCPGYINKLTENALRAVDYILVPAIADIDSLVGFQDLVDTKNRIREESQNVGLEILGVFFTMFAGIISVNRQIRQYCTETMGEDIILNTVIRRASVILDARAMGKPLAYHKPHDIVAEDYLTLTKEIIKRIKKRH